MTPTRVAKKPVGALKALKVLTRCCAPASQTTVRPAQAVDWSQRLKVLADATRLEILGLLAAADSELCSCEIEEHFDLKQPTISHHMKVLREAGFVSSEKRGLWVHYALRREGLEMLDKVRKALS